MAVSAVVAAALLVALWLPWSTGACTSHNSNTTLRDWMSRLSDAALNRGFKNLVLPGSHDSATHTIQFNATPAMQDSVYQLLLDAALDPLTGELVAAPIRELTVTQRGAIAEQLSCGVRALDLRVLYNANLSASFEECLFFSHSFAAVPVVATLLDIAAFLESAPREILVIQLASDWEHRLQTEPVFSQILAVVEGVLGSWLVPRNDTGNFENLTPALLLESGHRVFLTSDASLFNASSHPLIWPSAAVNSFWPNGQTVNASMLLIDDYLANQMPSNNSGELNLIFFTVTPSDASIVEDVIDHLGNLTNMTSLRDYARDMRRPTLEALGKYVARNDAKISIVSVDWPDYELISFVVSLNGVALT